ncbi:MAG: DUF1194 domain-containing protein [Rhodobacteraceae bacterium]|nr:MAG: DUF1194 domain-containing protein [Paracoccaceae bacterium]
MSRAAPALVLLIACLPLPAQACRLALVLALDVSSSVDAAEDRLQRAGLAAALVAPEVQRAFLASPDPVALAVYEWSGRLNQDLIVDWRLITGQADLLAVAEAVAGSTRGHSEFPTAMGYALGFAAGLFARGPDCAARTLDMAGDGINNEGFGPGSAYAAFPFDGVTVNGLVVTGAEGDGEDEADLRAFYLAEVLRGPGAFLEEAAGFRDYERAMRRKLEREVAPRATSALPAPAATEAPG